jgi:hypothetical protein
MRRRRSRYLTTALYLQRRHERQTSHETLTLRGDGASIFCDITQCSPVKANRRFDVTSHSSSESNSKSSKKSAWSRLKDGSDIPPKRLLTFIRPHRVIFQKTGLFIAIVARSSNPAKIRVLSRVRGSVTNNNGFWITINYDSSRSMAA